MSAAKSILIIAGLDPSGGAGIIADAKTVSDHGFRASGVCSCLTVQTTVACHQIEPVESLLFERQLEKLMADIPFEGVKIGMLPTVAHAQVVRKYLPSDVVVVVDPISSPARGEVSALPIDQLIAALAGADVVITPNSKELSQLGENAAVVRQKFGLKACITTPGMDESSDSPRIEIATEDGQSWLPVPLTGNLDVHGTGCAFSTALCCELAKGTAITPALMDAMDYVADKCAFPACPGKGRPQVH